MGTFSLPDMYALALGPMALGLWCTYQANYSFPCYNYYIHTHIRTYIYVHTYTYHKSDFPL